MTPFEAGVEDGRWAQREREALAAEGIPVTFVVDASYGVITDEYLQGVRSVLGDVPVREVGRTSA